MSRKSRKSNAPRRDIAQEVTDRILAQLAAGVAPWRKPWRGGSAPVGMPVNGSTGRPYSGVNVLLLWGQAMDAGYSSSAWMTFKQAKSLGGCVRKGEKGTGIVFFKTLVKEEANDRGEMEERRIPMLRGYTVFNTEQIDGLKGDEGVTEVDPRPGYERACQVLDDSGAIVRHGGGKAFYMPSADRIQLPGAGCFESVDAYWATALHELAHWTGHKSRLDRQQEGFGSNPEAYAFEELIAELSSAFLCADTGINLDSLQHASYLDHWVRMLKDDKRAIIRAAAAARKVHGFLMPEQTADAVLARHAA